MDSTHHGTHQNGQMSCLVRAVKGVAVWAPVDGGE